MQCLLSIYGFTMGLKSFLGRKQNTSHKHDRVYCKWDHYDWLAWDFPDGNFRLKDKKEGNNLDEWVMERYDLAKERVSEIPQETISAEPYRDFFVKEAAFLQQIISCDG